MPATQTPATTLDPQRAQEVAAVQEKYAKRIKARLARPEIDIVSARDGILDCFVATYFGGLKEGVAGYLGIDAREEQVAQIAQTLFEKRLVGHGASFEKPTVDALDRVKTEVDRELHFSELPGELRGLHDQVCSLMLSKADGMLEHDGDRSAVASAAHKPTAVAPISAPAPKSPRSPGSSAARGLRDALSAYLDDTANVAREGAETAELRARVEKLSRLVDVLAEFA